MYEPGDHVFLFGFSRGAFTVRALAGLTWRYGLPSANKTQARNRFAEAWKLFIDEFPDEDGSKARKALEFRAYRGQRQCPIHFLGLWDTVKSYGGLHPVMLPHLRHNPSVAVVRHALALDERRGWFEVTTWGWLDSDQESGAAKSRLAASDIDAIKGQDVVEVWFSGCHSDIGGGGRSDGSSSIALRWMLGEAKQFGLKLTEAGKSFLAISSSHERPKTQESRTPLWRIIELKQRLGVTNAGVWPSTFKAKRGASLRKPLESIRSGTIMLHESVADLKLLGPLPKEVRLKSCHTLRY
jgi:uncharacterized protein (DUF2235 family)